MHILTSRGETTKVPRKRKRFQELTTPPVTKSTLIVHVIHFTPTYLHVIRHRLIHSNLVNVELNKPENSLKSSKSWLIISKSYSRGDIVRLVCGGVQ